MRVVGLVGLGAVALASLPLVVPIVRAQAASNEDGDGVIIRIGPDQGTGAERREERRLRRRFVQPGLIAEAPVAVSRFWIGIGGTPLPDELRAHLNVAPDEGVLVRTVAPDSPAAEAGVQQFDVILSANGAAVTDVSQLADIVGAEGESEGRIALEVLRRGERKRVEVTPIERPVEAFADRPQRGGRLRGLFGPDGLLDGSELLDGDGLLGGAESLLQQDALEGLGDLIPQIAGAGVSVSVQRQGDGPAKVTVQQGGQSWEFDEGDQEAIAELPDNVRPMVERMMAQNGGALQQGFEGFGFGGPGFQMQFQGTDGLAERIRALQERMRAMQQGFGGLPADPVGPGDPIEPLIELDEAPAFNPGAAAPAEEVEAGPIEIEIPDEPKP